MTNFSPQREGNSGRRRSAKRGHRITGEDILVFVIPFFQFYEFTLIGVLSGTDLLLLVTFLVYFFRKRIIIPAGNARKFYLFAGMWLVSQIITDLMRHSAFSELSRGWSAISLLMINFAVLCTLLYRKPLRITIYGWGIVAAGVITMLFTEQPDQLEDSNVWKMGWAYYASMAVFLYVSRKRCSNPVRLSLMFGIGILHFLLSARSSGGICLAAAFYTVLTASLRRRESAGVHVSRGLKIALGTTALIGAISIYAGYSYAAAEGYLGDEARDKFETESSGQYGVLLGGRGELLSTIPAIIDSPIIGHGSWAHDVKYLVQMRQALALLRYKGALEMTRDQLVEGLIPAHSFLLGAWVWAGFLGAVFWAWVWTLIVKALSVVYPAAAHLLPLMAFFSVMLLWDILFSPFGLDRRHQVPYYLVLIFTYYDLARSGVKQEQEAPGSPMLRRAASAGD